MKRYISIIFITAFIFTASAQVGYQVTLLDTATGEPRANESVSVSLSITDASGSTIFSGNQNATTDNFGILSLEVGNANTFENANWNNMPFYISATVDGVMIGKSQILSVPIAEHAKHTGTLTSNILAGAWRDEENGNIFSITFSSNKRCSYSTGDESKTGRYEIEGNFVFMYLNGDYKENMVLHYSKTDNSLTECGHNNFVYKK